MANNLLYKQLRQSWCYGSDYSAMVIQIQRVLRSTAGSAFTRPFSAPALLWWPTTSTTKPNWQGQQSRTLASRKKKKKISKKLKNTVRYKNEVKHAHVMEQKQQKELKIKRAKANKLYRALLCGLLEERHNIELSKEHKTNKKQNKPMAEKWAKKSWKLALLLHWKERHPTRDMTPLTKDVADLFDEQDKGNEDLHEFGLDQATKWNEAVRVALNERGVTNIPVPEYSHKAQVVPASHTVRLWQYLLMDSVLEAAGIELPPDTGYRESYSTPKELENRG